MPWEPELTGQRKAIVDAIEFYSAKLGKSPPRPTTEKRQREILEKLKNQWETEKTRIAAPVEEGGQKKWTNPITGAVTYTAPDAPDPYTAGYYMPAGYTPPSPNMERFGYDPRIQGIMDAATGGEDPFGRVPLPAGMPQQYTNAAGQLMYWDGSGQYIQIGFDPEGVYQPEGAGPIPQPEGDIPTDAYGNPLVWNAQKGVWYDPSEGPPADYVSPYQQWQMGQPGAERTEEARRQAEMIEWYRQQQQTQLQFQQTQQEAQLQAQRETQLATLRAQPASWLEYASLAETTPAVQPWMLPLMPQQYAGTQAGEPLPGWSPQGESLGNLPQLTTPSTQYLARMGPTARQQYGGYKQARTGSTPEETQFRLWSQAPPSGMWGGLNYRR